MKHKHHIIPKHMGGSNDLSNLIELSIDEHAEAHRRLYEEHGHEQDKIAWLCLSGQISSDEARRMAVSISLKGKPKTEEHKKKLSEARRKRTPPTLGKKLPPASKERKQKISQANKGGPGRPFPCTKEHKEKLKNAALKRPLFTCVTCGKKLQKASLVRWHGLDGIKCST